MAPRPNVSVQRTKEVLEAAMAVFARLGFHKARMDDIAEEAKVSKGVLYFYFKSKDEIIESLLQHLFAQPLKELHGLLQAEGTVGEKLLALTQTMAKEVDAMSPFLPVAFEFYALAGRNKAVNEFLKKYYQQIAADLAALIQQGIDQGEFRADTDPIQIARAISAIYEGMALLWILERGGFDWLESSLTSIKILIQGMQTATKP